MKVEPFQINVAQEVLDDLRDRLKRTRWPDAEGAGWDQGTNLGYMQELAGYWLTGYDWRQQEANLNQLAQFKTEIDGVDIHFIHARGRGPHPMPLVLTHGWPDTCFRFRKVIPMLADPEQYGGQAADAFDVVAPSLPGFGFSGHHALGSDDVAGLWAKLMAGLGYHSYAAAGGDIGSGVTRSLAVQHPEAVTAIHLTDVGFRPRPEEVPALSPAEQAYVSSMQQWLAGEGAYLMLQSTKPQTLAFALNDSPVGLAAWQVEKFRAWSDCGGDVEKRFTKDELLTNIMLYWATETAGSAARVYLQNARATARPGGPLSAQKSRVPAAVAVFPGELARAPRPWAERNLTLRRYTIMPRGGHFAALEEPELFVDDLREFLREFHTPGP